MKPAFLNHVSHRPWPLPGGSWQWQQSWLELAFLHFRAAPQPLARLLPAGVTLQQFDNTAWLGVVPFRMANVSPRGVHRVTAWPAFPELNLRTYVEVGGKPGVWFFSLDAASRPVVWGGRQFFNLPYFFATITQERRGGWMHYSSRRQGAAASFVGRYRGIGPEFHAAPGTFEHWLTERYCLYARSRRGVLSRVDVHHAPWPLQQGEVEIEDTSLFGAAGLTVLPDTPLCHYSAGVDVVSFAPERL
jgi:uncharacterized protein